MKKVIFILTSLFLMKAQALTIDKAISAASESSQELKVLRLENDSASWSVTKARSGYLPKLELEGRHLFSERFEELEVPFGAETFVMPAIQPYSALGVTASYNLFNGFRTTHELAAAHAEKESADYRLKRAQDKKRIEIESLFYKALASQILVQVADQNIESLQSHLNDINLRVKSGVSTRYDSLRVEVQLEDAKTEKMAAENAVVIARAKLFEAIGIPDDGNPLEGKIPTDFTRVDLKKLEMKTEDRTDRKALLAHNESLENMSKAAQSHWMPSVSLYGSYEWYNNINHYISEEDNRFKSAYQVGLKFNWNLFDGGADYAAQKQAAIANEIGSANLTKFDQNRALEFEEIKRRFEYNVATYNAKLSSIKKAEEAVRLARGGMRAGTRTNTEILDAVVDLNRARASAIKSQIDSIEALGQLELSVGHTL
jgi:outer membrane protein TolC